MGNLELLTRCNDELPSDLYLSLIHLFTIETYDIVNVNLRELIFIIYKLIRIDRKTTSIIRQSKSQ